MSGKLERHYLVLAVLVGFMAIIVPTIFGDLATDSWTKYIYNYQTLLTGALAVGAAFVTVHQMRRSDELQERRHRQLIKFQQRNDTLAIDRITAWLPTMLKACESSIRAYLSRPPDEEWNADRQFSLMTAMSRLHALWVDLRGPRTQAHSNLFSPLVHTQVVSLASYLDILFASVPLKPGGGLAPEAFLGRPGWLDKNTITTLTYISGLAPQMVLSVEDWAKTSLAEMAG